MVTVFAAFKGGVGKTTSTLIIGDILSSSGSLLYVDTDPQANLTKYFGVSLSDIKKKNVLNAIDSGSLKKNVISLGNGIDLLPSTIALSDFEAKFATTVGKELLLKSLLKDELYKNILIDTQPAMTIITRNSLFAADRVIVPVEPDEWSVEGALSTIRNIEAFKNSPLKNEMSISDIYILPTKFKTLSFYEKGYKKVLTEVFSTYPILPAIVYNNRIKAHRSGRKWSGDYYKDYKGIVKEIWQNQ